MNDYTSQSVKEHALKSGSELRKIKQILKKAGRLKPQRLDGLMLHLHNNEFEKFDCLKCAQCCKNISPSIYRSDIKRMASALKMSTSEFTDTYLLRENDQEFIFNSTPCPFLQDDNYCKIYASRPRACREYPHTNRKRFYQILDLTVKNTQVCPAAYNIVKNMDKLI